MSKIVRYQGDVRAFASDAQGMERTVFGGTNQADDLTSQITASFLRGWGIVGASEHPSLEDFNAAMYAMSQFIAYQHQMGVPEWHAEQEYHIGSICTHNGESYQSLQNANIGSQPPSAKWTPVLTSKNGLANLGLGEARYVIQRGANVNGAWIRWSDGAIDVFGTGGSNDNGLAKVVYPIALPKLSRFISIAERIRTDYEATPNNVHVSMIVDDQVSNTGFYVRCQMYDGRPSTSAFSWRVYCAPV
ncbi:carbohydrate-binding protein [Escherichia coli]